MEETTLEIDILVKNFSYALEADDNPKEPSFYGLPESLAEIHTVNRETPYVSHDYRYSETETTHTEKGSGPVRSNWESTCSKKGDTSTANRGASYSTCMDSKKFSHHKSAAPSSGPSVG